MGDELKFVDTSESTRSTAPGSQRQQRVSDGVELLGGDAESSTSLSNRLGIFKTARHPYVCLFHILFKVGGTLSFIFSGVISDNFILNFVLTTLFLSFDFWTVKNVTGRLLVGMRWWDDIKEDGSSTWRYESTTDERQLNMTDKWVFWTALIIWPLVWISFLIIEIVRFKWSYIPIVFMGMVLASSNLYGYQKCSSYAQKQLRDLGSSGGRVSALSSMIPMVSSFMSRGGGGGEAADSRV